MGDRQRHKPESSVRKKERSLGAGTGGQKAAEKQRSCKEMLSTMPYFFRYSLPITQHALCFAVFVNQPHCRLIDAAFIEAILFAEAFLRTMLDKMVRYADAVRCNAGDARSG